MERKNEFVFPPHVREYNVDDHVEGRQKNAWGLSSRRVREHLIWERAPRRFEQPPSARHRRFAPVSISCSLRLFSLSLSFLRRHVSVNISRFHLVHRSQTAFAENVFSPMTRIIDHDEGRYLWRILRRAPPLYYTRVELADWSYLPPAVTEDARFWKWILPPSR